MSRAGAGVLIAAGLIAACTAMNGVEVIPIDDTTDPGASSSSGKTKRDGGEATSSSSGDPNQCNLLKEPAKPAAADPGGSDVTLTFAMRQLVPNNEGTPFGLDLDGLCTCFTPAGATTPGPDACKRTTSACDDPQNIGLDNAGALLFKQINGQGGVNIIDVENGHVAGGQIGLLVHIEGYNGLANDDSVSVRFVRSAGISGGPNPARNDTWPDSTDSFRSTEAYVANKLLVARFDEVEVPFLLSTPSPAKMKGAIMTGAIANGNAIPEIIVAGRSNTGELVNSVGQLEAPIIGALCQSMQFDDANRYRNFAAAACKVSDLPTEPAKTGDLNTPCDAMSFGVKMLMIPATLGGEASLSVGGDRCGGLDGYPVACPNP